MLASTAFTEETAPPTVELRVKSSALTLRTFSLKVTLKTGSVPAFTFAVPGVCLAID